MRLLLAALLLACAASAEAAPHTLIVRMTQGMRTYSHTMKLEDGAQANFVGKPDGGGGDRNMIVNTVLSPAGAAYSMELQLELAHADKTQTFQVQTSVQMRSGDHLTQTECGDWKVELILDGKPGRAAPAKGAWTSGGLDNYRLTTDVASSGKRRRCRQVVKLGTQSNIVDSATTDGRKRGFILNTVLAEPSAAGFGIQYQLEQSPLELQGQDTLTLGSKRAASASGGKVSFLLEGASPAAKAAPAAAPSAAAPSGNNEGAVPLLR
jgi:hypothetical protein